VARTEMEYAGYAAKSSELGIWKWE
jgi:hypothetical protein